MAKSCKGCRFWRTISGEAAGIHACHFLLDTGIPRYCSPEECNYHTAKGLKEMSQGKALTPEVIRLIEQMSADGKSISQICNTLGVSSSTVTRVRNGKLKSPETVSTPIEPVPEETNVDNIDTSIIPDTEENVKPESQLAELEKSDVHYTRIDGQCRTETDSTGQKRTAQDRNGQHRTETDNGGQYSPYVSAVDEAALERRERLLEKISELQSEISYYESEISRLEEFHLKYMEVQSNGT